MLDLKTFNKIYAKDFPSWDSYVIALNENIKFASTNSTIDDFIGKCDISDLPSYHPYWSNEVKKGIVKRLNILEIQYKECVANPSKIKYYFNNTTSLEDINNKIKKLKNEQNS